MTRAFLTVAAAAGKLAPVQIPGSPPPQPSSLTVGEMIDLARGGLASGEERLEQLFAWRHERGVAKSRETFALVAVILTPLLAAVFDPKKNVHPLAAVGYVAAAVICFVGGLAWLDRLRDLDVQYVRALRFYALVRRASGNGG